MYAFLMYTYDDINININYDYMRLIHNSDAE